MKKNIAKPKFYTLDEDSIDKPCTGFIILKHINAKLSPKLYDKLLVPAYTKLYYGNEVEKNSNRYIQITSDYLSESDFINFVSNEYNLKSEEFDIVKVFSKKKFILYLVILNLKKEIDLPCENIIEMIQNTRLRDTNNYWGLLSLGFSKTRKEYLNRCLYPIDTNIKLELRLKKVYKALIGN